MSTLAARLPYQAANTVARVDSSVPNEALIYDLVNRIMASVADRTLYEDVSEPRPSSEAVASAAVTLYKLSADYRDELEIEPFWGQLSLIWRSGHEKRVKATFGGDGRLSIYYERMADGHVVDSGMLTPQNNFTNNLGNRLAWLKS